MIKQLVEEIVKSLVEFPDLVEVVQSQREDGRQMIGIKMSDRDLGKVIGRNGRTIKAIRAMVYSLVPAGQDIIVDIAS